MEVKQEQVLNKHYILKKLGFNLHDTMIWQKGTSPNFQTHKSNNILAI